MQGLLKDNHDRDTRVTVTLLLNNATPALLEYIHTNLNGIPLLSQGLLPFLHALLFFLL